MELICFSGDVIMIVLIDTQKQNILLYKEDGLVTVPFNKANNIFSYMGSNRATYVTNAITAGAEDIVSLVRSMGIKIEDNKVSSSAVEERGDKYLHTPGEGMIYISENLIFKDKYDCKLIDKRMKATIKKEQLLKTLIENGKIRIIGANERARLIKKFKQIQIDDFAKQEAEAQKMDNMLSGAKDGGNSAAGHDIASEIDLNADIRRGKKIDVGGGVYVDTLSELLDRTDE
jgi:hypothetical protein